MLSEKQITELEKIIDIAKEKENKINSMLFYNLIVAMPGKDNIEDKIYEMQEYLTSQGVEIVFDGVETEEETGNPIDSSIKPFNPSTIDIIMKPITLDSIVKRIENEEINMETEFQRKSGLWSEMKKSQLIESLLLKIPLPAFYFDESREDSWLIIDGLQRLTALKEFMVDKSLKLEGLEFFLDLNGCGFDDLPRVFTRRLEETSLVSFNIRAGTPENVKFNIFKRINTGSLELSSQEIRHAIFFGNAVHILKKLVNNQEFKDTMAGSIKAERMQDQEFVLRYIAVCHYGIEKFETNSEEFLNNTMQYLNGIGEAEEEKIEVCFARVMKSAREILGKHAFRKIGADDMRRPVNKAIFEGWCYCLGQCSDMEIEKLIKRKKEVVNSFRKLCAEEKFQAALKHSRKTDFSDRIKKIKKLIREEIKNDKRDKD